MNITWLGHACWYCEISGQRIIIDPFFSTDSVRKTGESLSVDYILCTHGHADHCSDVLNISKRNPNAILIGCFELVNWFSKKGIRNIEPGNPGGTIKTRFGSVKITPAWHSSQMPDGSYGGIAVGFVIQSPQGNIYLAGDTGLFGDMAIIGKIGLKAAIVPIGDRFTMGPEDSVSAVELLKPELAIPSHYNTWPPINQNPELWSDAIKKQTAARPLVFNPGEKKEL